MLPRSAHQFSRKGSNFVLRARVAHALSAVRICLGSLTSELTTTWMWFYLQFTTCCTQPRQVHVSAICASTACGCSDVRTQTSSVLLALASSSRAGSGGCHPRRYSTQPRSSPGNQVPYVTQVKKYPIGSPCISPSPPTRSVSEGLSPPRASPPF